MPLTARTPTYGGTGSSGLSAASFTLARPAGLASGDLCFIWVTAGSVSAPAITAPSGFTAIPQTTVSNYASRLFYRVCTGTESATFTVGLSSTTNGAGVCIAYPGAVTSPVFDPSTPTASGAGASSAATVTAASITTTSSGDQVIWFGGAVNSFAAGSAITAPSGFTGQGAGYETSYTAGGCSVKAADLTQASAGATGSAAGSTTSATTESFGIQIAIVPAASGVTVPLAAATVAIAAPAPTPSGGGGTSGIVNQWQAAFYQPPEFGNMPPALQSVVIALDPSTSVGGGSGTPTAGNWLFLLAGWNQTGLPAATVGNADDIHSFWRPGDVTTSTWAVSTPAGNTRTSVWYTPNLARAPGSTYTAPNGAVAGMACTVIEVSGLGPWDVVTGITTAYAAAATSLTMALPAPAASSFVVGAVTGDNFGAFQDFSPAGWSPLETVVATNGVNTVSDAVLTAATITTSGSLSVTATATTEDLSGVLIAVQVSAPSPIPAGHNPNWPLTKFEGAFGGGFQTPPDELTWYDLSNRLWSWDETTGVQYQLGDLQATNLDLELDNFDNALASDNVGSPYYSNAANANMSFAAGITPWAESGNSALAHSSAQAYSSSPGAVAMYSLEVTPDGVTAQPGAISEHVPVTAADPYSISAWFYSAAGWPTGAQAAVTWYDSGGSVISSTTADPVAVPAATWTQVTLPDQAAPSGAVGAVVTVQLSGVATAPFWVAEAALAPGATAVATGLVTTGVPVRIRAAIGTIGGVVVNRWYVIQRNAEEWQQQVDEAFRRFVAVTATDIWSTMSNIGVTPYRGEVIQDRPYAWYPMDDAPVEGGVLPTSLRNAAQGNTTPLNIILSPLGGVAQDPYSINGYDNSLTVNTRAIAVYTVGADEGWMPGDPQSEAQAAESTQSGNATTAQPGSAAWQQTGGGGNTGSHGWFLSVNDTGLPSLTDGVTAECWFNWGLFGSSTEGEYDDAGHDVLVAIAAQPYSPLTLMTLTTGSAAIAVLQLDLGGSLNLITYDGSTPTSNPIYTASDLRGANWHQYVVELTATTWQVLVDGGLTANVSGTATGMSTDWEWLILNGDMGTAGGGSASDIAHGGVVSISHLSVYGYLLPDYRVMAHYNAALTAFGLLPAPSSPALEWVADGITPDGSTQGGDEFASPAIPGTGAYGGNAMANAVATMSVVVTATAGSYTSGPAAWQASAGYGSYMAAWVSWGGLAPLNDLYTSDQLGNELHADVALGSGDALESGYGATTAASGFCHVSGGTGASPPASPTDLGDTVGQRLERVMAYGLVSYPGRCIDPAPLLVQGATDVGGQATADNILNQVDSDGGLFFVDNLGNATYWQRPHLTSQYADPAWTIGPANSPYYREIKWTPDPQRVWDAITITPFSPDNALLPLVIPSQAAQVLAAQRQFGAQPKQITNYLQSVTEMQNQADWLFAHYGTVHVRAENVKLDAAPDPSLFPMILGINVGDVATGQMWQIGAGGITWTFRVSEIKRHIEYNGDTGRTEASAVLKLDYEPSDGYWS